jgi:hypothetical protein
MEIDGGTGDMTPSPPTLRFLSTDVDRIYVVGFPAYCALTVAANPTDASLSRVPAVGWQGARGMVGVTLSMPGSTEPLHHSEPRAIADPSTGVPVTRLRAGESRRMLIDLTEVLPEQLDPGSYSAAISFGPESLRAVSSPVDLKFRAPTDREREALSELAEEVAQRGTWGQWTRMPPLDPARHRLPWGTDDPLRLNWILRDVYYGPEMLPAIPLQRLDVLDGIFWPEREALRAELLAVRDDPAAFAAQAALAKRLFPGLSSWMDAIAEGESEIAWTRGQRGA